MMNTSILNLYLRMMNMLTHAYCQHMLHFPPVQTAIAIAVIHLEGPLELVLQLPSEDQVNGRYVLHEVDLVVLLDDSVWTMLFFPGLRTQSSSKICNVPGWCRRTGTRSPCRRPPPPWRCSSHRRSAWTRAGGGFHLGIQRQICGRAPECLEE